ncbi:MAG: hypothetical protein JNJ60_16035, partial [Rhodocyclaceae bacterium]|nr:hypothetical protein [Rhodocyclaceae bacterium]
ENVIVGRLIPAGTGLAYHRTRRAQKRGVDLAPDRVLFETDLEAPSSTEHQDAA